MEFWAQLVSGTLAISLLGYIWYKQLKVDEKEKAAIKDELARVTKEAENHYKKCDEVPKSLLLEKLENLCEKQDIYQNENRTRFDKGDKHFEETFKRLSKTEIALAFIQGAKDVRLPERP
jgi:hypothetical protein